MADNVGLIRDEKRIHELEGLTRLRDDAYFVVSQDNLTRKVTLLSLRLAFIAEEAHESKFYTSEMIDKKIAILNKKILDLSNLLHDQSSILSDIKNDIIINKQDIIDIRKAIEDIHKRIDTLYSWGTAIPTTLETGKLYFQYFIN